MAVAHRDSISTIGSQFYPPDTVAAWAAGLSADVYVNAMAGGEVFFIANDGHEDVLGFSSHRVDGAVHGTSVYVRGLAARRGIGSSLFQLAEADAIAAGASSLEIDASLAAVQFYRAHGFEEIGRGEHELPSGQRMECVFMRKEL
jgi:ribosomal protein S18 acetylase RimI-like enzyme